MRGVFKKFDFSHPDFLLHGVEMQKLYRIAYKSKMTGSEWICPIHKHSIQQS